MGFSTIRYSTMDISQSSTKFRSGPSHHILKWQQRVEGHFHRQAPRLCDAFEVPNIGVSMQQRIGEKREIEFPEFGIQVIGR